MKEGKTKRVISSGVPGRVIIEFKDEVSLRNGKERFALPGKGKACARVSALVFRFLAGRGIETHFLEEMGESEIMVEELDMIPLEVVVWNKACGSLVSKLGLRPGEELEEPLVEFYLKNDEKEDPLVSAEHLRILHILDEEELEEIKRKASRVNRFLLDLFGSKGIVLGSVKMEFGRLGVNLVLGDEISPDTCLMWRAEDGRPLGKLAVLEGRREPEDYEVVVRVMEEKPGKEVYVYVRPKQGIMDPQGQATMNALRSLGYPEVEDVRVGRYIVLRLRDGSSRDRVDEMCRRLLANPVIEDYEIKWVD